MFRKLTQSVTAASALVLGAFSAPCLAADRDIVSVSPTSSIVGGTPFSIDANTMALGGGTYVLHTGGRTTLRPTSLKLGSGYIDLNEHLMIVPRNSSISYQSGGAMLLTTGDYASPGLTLSGSISGMTSRVSTGMGAGTGNFNGNYHLGTFYGSTVTVGSGTISLGGGSWNGWGISQAPVRTWAEPVPPPPIPQTFPGTELRLLRDNLGYAGHDYGSIGSDLVTQFPERLSMGLAVAEDLDLPGKYARRDIVSGDLIVRAALLGDANLDGRVDKYDLRRLSQQFLSTDRRWSWGDFDHDGNVNLTDFALLTRNYGLSLNDVIGQTELPRSRGVLTPEPAVGTMTVVAMGLIRRRR